MGIDLGSGDRGMTKHFLHTADVRAVHKKIGGKGMAQSVRMDIFDNAGFGCIIFDDALDAARRDAQATRRDAPTGRLYRLQFFIITEQLTFSLHFTRIRVNGVSIGDFLY